MEDSLADDFLYLLVVDGRLLLGMILGQRFLATSKYAMTSWEMGKRSGCEWSLWMVVKLRNIKRDSGVGRELEFTG